MTTTAEPRTRSYTWHDPAELAAAGTGLSGVEFLRSLAAGDRPRPPIAETLDFTLTEVDEGRAVFEVTPAEFHYNPIGVVHGGLAMTLLDSALGCAIHSTLPAGDGYTTIEIKVNLTRAITATTGRLRCEADVIHVGGRLATAEGRIVDDAGRLYAHATTTCMLFRGER